VANLAGNVVPLFRDPFSDAESGKIWPLRQAQSLRRESKAVMPVIETHEHKGDFKEPEACLFFGLVVVGGLRVKGSCVLCFWATRAGAGPESLIRMSWLPRLQIALFVVGIVGMLFLIFGHWERSSVAYFALGMVISGGSFLLNLIISGVTAIFQPRLRKVSIWMAIVSLLMLLGLVLPWRMP
jgi:hypothetical protein